MNTATINIKTEPHIKAEAQKTAKEIGINLSSILNAFLRQFIKTKTITFSALYETPSEYLLKSIKKSEEDVKAGRVTKFKTGKDALKYLDKEIENERRK
ncbi:MAG: type II toxin-antitoxin system RelB/DinJ family antitoxin [Candidatus Levybacteria bacterium]|nr:type II toxin-antitoxin system RelB/DinJ family antitoxin [Candidatus Levybacteria bacterium]